HGGVQAPDRSPASSAGKDEASRCIVGQLGDDVLRRLGQPHAVALAVLCAGPAERRHRLAPPFPPTIFDVFEGHLGNFARALAVIRIMRSALPSIRPTSSQAAQKRGTSLSLRMRSRLLVSLRVTPRQGLAGNSSSLVAQEKIADAAARIWLARMRPS